MAKKRETLFLSEDEKWVGARVLHVVAELGKTYYQNQVVFVFETSHGIEEFRLQDTATFTDVFVLRGDEVKPGTLLAGVSVPVVEPNKAAGPTAKHRSKQSQKKKQKKHEAIDNDLAVSAAGNTPFSFGVFVVALLAMVLPFFVSGYLYMESGGDLLGSDDWTHIVLTLIVFVGAFWCLGWFMKDSFVFVAVTVLAIALVIGGFSETVRGWQMQSSAATLGQLASLSFGDPSAEELAEQAKEERLTVVRAFVIAGKEKMKLLHCDPVQGWPEYFKLMEAVFWRDRIDELEECTLDRLEELKAIHRETEEMIIHRLDQDGDVPEIDKEIVSYMNDYNQFAVAQSERLVASFQVEVDRFNSIQEHTQKVRGR